MKNGYKNCLKIVVIVILGMAFGLYAMEDRGNSSEEDGENDLFYRDRRDFLYKNSGREQEEDLLCRRPRGKRERDPKCAEEPYFEEEPFVIKKPHVLRAAAQSVFSAVKKLLPKSQEEKDKALFEAVLNGDSVGLMQALDGGADIEARTVWHKETPLLRACNKERAWPEAAYCLLDKKANVNAIDRLGQTPLMAAANIGDVALVRRLLESNATVNNQATGGDTVTFCKGDTALMVAAKEGHSDVVRLLLEYKAMINSRNLSNKTPLMQAAKECHKEAVKILLQAGAFFNAEDIDSLMHWRPQMGTMYRDRLVEAKRVIKQAQVEHVLEEQDWVPKELMAFNDVMFNVNSATAINILVNIVGAYAMPYIDNKVLQDLEAINNDPTMQELLAQELMARSKKRQGQQESGETPEIKEKKGSESMDEEKDIWS